ncbi:hypothetical protein M218_25880 [Burkholderia pseudomallei MSHR338]|nr:conserved hypothetical protein [Burkholderia pseudomallei MSHR346]EQA86128.1 hypothetical protein M218_25880 [Burkholderia pseudomallei MSHR338]
MYAMPRARGNRRDEGARAHRPADARAGARADARIDARADPRPAA